MIIPYTHIFHRSQKFCKHTFKQSLTFIKFSKAGKIATASLTLTFLFHKTQQMNPYLQWCLRRPIQKSPPQPAQCVTTWSGTQRVIRESRSSTCSQLTSDAGLLSVPSDESSPPSCKSDGKFCPQQKGIQHDHSTMYKAMKSLSLCKNRVVFSNALSIPHPGKFSGAVPPSSGQKTTPLEMNVTLYNLCYMYSLSLLLSFQISRLRHLLK